MYHIYKRERDEKEIKKKRVVIKKRIKYRKPMPFTWTPAPTAINQHWSFPNISLDSFFIRNRVGSQLALTGSILTTTQVFSLSLPLSLLLTYFSLALHTRPRSCHRPIPAVCINSGTSLSSLRVDYRKFCFMLVTVRAKINV